MIIKTKYDIGDEVYFFDDDKIKHGEIIGIYTTHENNIKDVDYAIDGVALYFTESQLFKTTKELYRHIEKEIKKLNKGI